MGEIMKYKYLLLISLLIIISLLPSGTSKSSSPLIISENHTDYDLLYNTLYLDVQNTAHHPISINNLNTLFTNSHLTQNINITRLEVLTNQSVPTYNWENNSLGSVSGSYIVNNCDNLTNSTNVSCINTTYYYITLNNTNVTCDYVIDETTFNKTIFNYKIPHKILSCIKKEWVVNGSRIVYSYTPTSFVKKKSLSNKVLKHEFSGLSMKSGKKIKIPAHTKFKLRITYSHPLAYQLKVPKNISEYNISLVDNTGLTSFLDPSWYNDSWSYRQPITITNNVASDLSNYQIKIILNSSNVGSHYDWTNDEDSIRFTYYNSTSDSESEIPYWIQDYNSTAETATIWVNVTYIPASSTSTIYFYYHNTEVSSESNGTNTFDYFVDGSSDPSITESDYAVGASNNYISYDSTNERINYKAKREKSNSGYGGFPYWINTSTTLNDGWEFSFDWEVTASSYSSYASSWEFGLSEDKPLDQQNDGGSDSILIHDPFDTRTTSPPQLRIDAYDYSSNTHTYSGYTATLQTGKKYKIKFKKTSDNITLEVYDGDTLVTSTSLDSSSLGLSNSYTHILYNSGGGGNPTSPYEQGVYDNLIIRKYASTEPTYSIGEEEVPGVPPNKPSINVPPSPVDASVGNSLSVVLNATVTDPDSNSLNVSFWDNTSGTPLQIGDTQVVSNGSSAQVTWSGLYSGMTYDWFVKVYDGTYYNYSEEYSFTTKYFEGTTKLSDGTPVVNADVIIINQSDNTIYATTTSDANGEWSYSVPAGTYLVIGYDPNNSSRIVDVEPFISIS